VTFTVGSATIVANASTDYDRGKCSDLRAGLGVEVRGRPRTNGIVDAERIKFEKQGER